MKNRNWRTHLAAGGAIAGSLLAVGGCDSPKMGHPTTEGPRFSSKGDRSDPIPFYALETYRDDRVDLPSPQIIPDIRVKLGEKVSYLSDDEQQIYETMSGASDSILGSSFHLRDDLDRKADPTTLRKDFDDRKEADIEFIGALSKMKTLPSDVKARVFAVWLREPAMFDTQERQATLGNLPLVFAVMPELQTVQFRTTPEGSLGNWKDALKQRVYDCGSMNHDVRLTDEEIQGIENDISVSKEQYSQEIAAAAPGKSGQVAGKSDSAEKTR